MKLNKLERQALAALDRIVESLKGGPVAVLTQSDAKALGNVFGILLREITCSKNEVNGLFRGKESVRVLIESPIGGFPHPPINCFFPFQVKEEKSYLKTCPHCNSQMRVAL